MTALSRLLGLENRQAPGLVPVRTGGVRSFLLSPASGMIARTGRNVTPETAMGHSAVYAAVRTLAEHVGSLPLETYRTLPDGGRERIYNRQSELVGLAPNPYMPAGEVWETVVAHMLLWGNAFLYKARGADGRVMALFPVYPARVAVGIDADHTPIYRINTSNLGTDFTPTLEGRDVMAVGNGADILHFRNLSLTGVSGLSPITQVANPIATHLAQEEYIGTYWRNAATPAGLLSAPGTLSGDTRKDLTEAWNANYGGLDRVARTAILDQGVTWQSITHSLSESQHLDQRRYAVEDIARIFNVPASLIGGSSSSMRYENPILEALNFAQFSLRIWCNRIERRIQHDPDVWIDRTLTPRFDLEESLLRADRNTRYQANESAVRAGWKSPADVRREENLPHVDGLDVYTQNLKPRLAGESGELTKLTEVPLMNTNEVPNGSSPILPNT
jgi:HK97 family phage portal protein